MMLTALDDSKKIYKKEISISELTKNTLKNIDDKNKSANALCYISSEAKSQAEALDLEIANNNYRSSLHGLSVVFKDNIDVVNIPTTVGSNVFINSKAKELDAPFVAKLRKLGMLIIGKANMDEFAAHVSGKTSAFGPAINPYGGEVLYSPGGSSSGVAVAVANKFAHIGIGSDTGGSVRIPAAWCGLVGLRPTQGLFNSFGVFPRGFSLDCPGFFTRTIQDMNLFYSELVSSPCDNEKENTIKKLIVPKAVFDFDCDKEVIADFKSVLEKWEKLGFETVNKDIPEYTNEIGEIVNIIRAYEFANTAGIYIRNFHDLNLVHPVIIKDMEFGESIKYEQYIEALNKKSELMCRMDSIIDNDSMLISPVSPCLPLKLDSELSDFALARTFVDFGSLAGVPTIVLQSGKSANGLPIGFQLLGKAWQEQTLIQMGLKFE